MQSISYMRELQFMQRRFNHQEFYGVGSLITAALMYGTFGIISRIVGYTLPLFYQSWMRVLVASILLAWSYRNWKTIAACDWPWIGLRMVASVLAFLLFFIAINALPVNLTYFIFYGGSTIGGFILGAVLFHERTTWIRLFSLGLSGIGLALVYGVGAVQYSPVFITLAFASGICTSLWNTISKKVSAYPATQMTFLDNSLSVPPLMIISLIVKEPWPLMEWSTAQGANLTLGALFAITGLLMVYGFRRVDAQIGTLIMLSEVLFAVMFGYLLFAEVPSWEAIIGGLLIIFSIMFSEIHWTSVVRPLYAHRRKTHR